MAIQRKKPKISSQAVIGEFKTLAILTGGVIIGSMSGKMIDKALNVDATSNGFNAKTLARPIVLLGAGTAGNLMFKDQNMKILAMGVGASGVLSGAKVILKKDLLAGLADFNFKNINGLGQHEIYHEPNTLSVDRYNPDLPTLSSPTSYNPEDIVNQSMVNEMDNDLSYIEII